MIDLQTMPLRFRVWDKEQKRFVSGSENGISVTGLAGFIAGKEMLGGFDLNRFSISQDTGLETEDGESIFTGDIISYEYEDEKPIIGVVEYNIGGIVVFRHHHSLDNQNFYYKELRDVAAYSRKIGTIWQNPELLEEKQP